MPEEDAPQIGIGEDKLDALKKKITETIEFYKKLQTLPLADKITAIGDETDKITEELVPKLNAKLLKKWRQRALKIEDANEDLANFEYGVCEEMTASSASVIFKEIHKVIKKFEWLAGHIGEVVLLLAATLGYATGRYGAGFWDAISEGLVAALSGDLDKALDKLGEVGDKGAEIMEFLARSAVLGLIAEIMQSTLAALSAAAYAATTQPVLQVKAATEEALMKDAFPQGRGRVIRIKPHRLRA